MAAKQTLLFTYIFRFQDKSEVKFDIRLDSQHLSIVRDSLPVDTADWTRLEVEQCPNCPLDPQDVSHCPIAQNISHIADHFSGHYSYEPIELEVDTENRRFLISTTLQRGISAMLGIYMVTSGCPIMDRLRPMVKYHLPVASMDETRYRAVSMYLMAQFYIHLEEGGEPDWDLEKFGQIYDGIKTVNKSFVKRLSNVTQKDASLNAVVILNHFADFIPFTIDEEMLQEMKPVFSAYIPKKSGK